MLVQFFRFSFVLFAFSYLVSAPLYGEEKSTGTGEESQTEQGEGTKKTDAGATVRRVHLVRETIQQAALADESVKKQVVWLDSPEGKDGSVSAFLALELYERSSNTQGAVLFLHGVDQHPNWPQVIKPLRTILTDDGWYTLSIMLPYENVVLAPKRELQVKQADAVAALAEAPRFSGRYSKGDKSVKEEQQTTGVGENPENSESDASGGGNITNEGDVTNEGDATDSHVIEGEPTETAADLEAKTLNEEVIDISADEKDSVSPVITFEEKVQLRLKAALDYIAQKGYQNVVIVGYQQGAQGVLDYLENNKGMLPEEGLTIIWIDALLEDGLQSTFGDRLGKDFPLKMLDVIDSSSRAGISRAKTRLGQAKRHNYMGYAQVKLPITDVSVMEVSTLTQRIRGWLKVNAPGMQRPASNVN